MIVYRICQTYPPDHDPIDGQGSFIRGGRWNPKGVHAVYTASSLALARSELARHINLDIIPDGYRVYEIEIPDGDCASPVHLPEEWDSDIDWNTTQAIGKKFLTDTSILCMKVPSVCDFKSYNIILNPNSDNYHQTKVVNDYPFEP